MERKQQPEIRAASGVSVDEIRPAAAASGVYWTRRRILVMVVIPWLFLLPILILHAFVVLFPAIQGIYYAFTDWSGIGRAEFVGLQNFVTMFTTDKAFQAALGRNLQWMVFFLIVPFALALFTASLLARVKRGSMFYRTALFMPYILPSIVTATIWRYLYNPRFGIGAQLANIGIRGLDVALLGRPESALWAIAFADNWHYWGFLMVLFLTAMQSIPIELYDAAKVDGANRFQEFWNVTLPGIRPVLLFMVMMSMIWSFLVFEYIWILTQGGPGGTSEVLGVVIYKNAFQRFEAGYAAAQGMTITLFAGLVVGLFLFLRRRGWDV
jgi:raffinose/stachyose/melibiose transport system permease protein